MIRPLARSDDPAVTSLVRRVAADLADPVSLEAKWTTRVSGHDEHLLGLWSAGELVAGMRVAAHRRPRLRHMGIVELLCPREVDPSPLLRATHAIVDDWTPLDRLQLELPADHPAVEAAVAQGYEVEVVARGRLADGRDQLDLGRLRPGFVPRPPGPPPPWPERRPREGVHVELRPVAERDHPEIAAMSIEPTNVWGTLQVPSASLEFYLDRYRGTPADHHVFTLLADGAVAGLGGVHPVGIPGVYMLGMNVARDWQGAGLGRRLLDHLRDTARALGARRLELAVWEDNVRARRLYETSGFVAEGVHRCDGIRAGGHASSLAMALRLEDRP